MSLIIAAKSCRFTRSRRARHQKLHLLAVEQSQQIFLGALRSSKVSTVEGIVLITEAAPRWVLKAFTLKRARLGTSKGKVTF